MLGNFKKAIFRALCLCCVFIGGGLMAEPTPKELFDQGKEILDFAVSGGGGAFRGDSLEAKLRNIIFKLRNILKKLVI
ncbi:hypothetical protein ACOWMK_01540 [Helicobacter pylori]